MTKIRAMAFVRHFFFPHARKTYALLLSIIISMHYISYAHVFANIANHDVFGKFSYLFGAMLNTKAITLFVLACITYFGISLTFDILQSLKPRSRHQMQHV